MLNISARKCSALVSPNANCLKREKSQLTSLGPISVFLPRLPIVPAGCSTNALASYQRLGSPRIGLLDAPGRTFGLRLEERRVGKEGRSRWSPYHLNKKYEDYG